MCHYMQTVMQIKEDQMSYEQKNEFFSPDGLIRIEWIDQFAKQFSEELADGYRFHRKDFTRSQLRNFYHEFLRIKSSPLKKDEKVIMVKMLKAKVKYKKGIVPEEFIQFITNLVDEIDKDDLFPVRFENACILMEALVAYNPKTK